jgi:hypothetical protein
MGLPSTSESHSIAGEMFSIVGFIGTKSFSTCSSIDNNNVFAASCLASFFDFAFPFPNLCQAKNNVGKVLETCIKYHFIPSHVRPCLSTRTVHSNNLS